MDTILAGTVAWRLHHCSRNRPHTWVSHPPKWKGRSWGSHNNPTTTVMSYNVDIGMIDMDYSLTPLHGLAKILITFSLYGVQKMAMTIIQLTTQILTNWESRLIYYLMLMTSSTPKKEWRSQRKTEKTSEMDKMEMTFHRYSAAYKDVLLGGRGNDF